jgi:hypothetical protein
MGEPIGDAEDPGEPAVGKPAELTVHEVVKDDRRLRLVEADGEQRVGAESDRVVECDEGHGSGRPCEFTMPSILRHVPREQRPPGAIRFHPDRTNSQVRDYRPVGTYQKFSA